MENFILLCINAFLILYICVYVYIIIINVQGTVYLKSKVVISLIIKSISLNDIKVKVVKHEWGKCELFEIQ